MQPRGAVNDAVTCVIWRQASRLIFWKVKCSQGGASQWCSQLCNMKAGFFGRSQVSRGNWVGMIWNPLLSAARGCNDAVSCVIWAPPLTCFFATTLNLTLSGVKSSWAGGSLMLCFIQTWSNQGIWFKLYRIKWILQVKGCHPPGYRMCNVKT